jgi:hypothetical protein
MEASVEDLKDIVVALADGFGGHRGGLSGATVEDTVEDSVGFSKR